MKAIAACSLNNVIGKDGGIPWHSKADFQWFKKVTLGQTLIMGRKTFETLPYLRDRNIVILCHGIATSPVIGRYEPHQLRFVNDIDALPRNGIVCGGAQVYQQLLPYCEVFYLTVMKIEVEGDTFLPKFDHLFPNRKIIEDNGELAIHEYSKF